LPLEGVGDVESVGEVHWSGFDEGSEEMEVSVFVRVVEGSFAKREKFGSDDSVNHMAFKPSHRLGFCNDYDVLVWNGQRGPR